MNKNDYDTKVKNLVYEQKNIDKLRKQLYARQLKKDMQRKIYQKQIQKLQIKKEHDIIQQNVKIANQAQNYRKRQNTELQKRLIYQSLRNNSSERKNSRGYHSSRDDSRPINFLEYINQQNQQRGSRIRQSLTKQKQLNEMQLQLKKQNKRNEMHKNYELDIQYLRNLEEFEKKRRQDKQQLIRKHQQNMKLYEELQQIKIYQKNKQDAIQAQKILRQNQKIKKKLQQQQLRNKLQGQQWIKNLQHQLQQKKAMKIQQDKNKLYQQELFKRNFLNQQKNRPKSIDYLKQLQIQIQQQKQKKKHEKLERMEGNLQFPEGNLSPAIFGKVYSHERRKQLQLLDKKFGFQNTLKQSGEFSLNNIPYEQKTNQFKQYNKIKEQLDKYRIQNKSFTVSPSKKNSIPTQAGINYQKLTTDPMGMQITNKDQIEPKTQSMIINNDNKQKNQTRSSVNNSRVNYKTLKSYDFITNREKIYNFQG